MMNLDKITVKKLFVASELDLARIKSLKKFGLTLYRNPSDGKEYYLFNGTLSLLHKLPTLSKKTIVM